MPGVSRFTEIVVAKPLAGGPEMVGVEIVGLRFTSDISRSKIKNWVKFQYVPE
jgi:hypothetical protein